MRRGGCWQQACWPSVPRKQSLAEPGQALAFVSQAFLSLSSRQQRLSRKNFDVAKELESYWEEVVSEHLFLLFFFGCSCSNHLVINNAFALLWLCSRCGEISQYCWGWGGDKATGLGRPPADARAPTWGPRPSHVSLATLVSRSERNQTWHLLPLCCFIPLCPSFSDKP